ncbi:ATP-binding cassette domain-containing protein [Brevinema andersonii]|uniref:ATP-binding cassette domain-containing protein n=1 Tax=Brevinema andersonii TaxID=34097 RepID=UPI000B82FD31
MKIQQARVFGVEGKSGSGKSTLLKLIMRFYDPQLGKVSIGTIPVKDINTNSLRQHIAYVTPRYLFI